MYEWGISTILGLLVVTLCVSVHGHVHHDIDEAVPVEKREELLRKWEQEVSEVC